MRANTVTEPDWNDQQPGFSALRRERSPLSTSRLLAGDWLHIHARWWHLVRAVDDALSTSIGVMPVRGGTPRPRRGAGGRRSAAPITGAQGLTACCGSRGAAARGAPS